MITLIIILLTAFVSLWGWIYYDIFRKSLFIPVVISENKEYFRFITSGFIHEDFVHLLVNMIVLFFFGIYLEYEFISIWGKFTGILVFMGFYIGSMVISNLPIYFMNRRDVTFNSLGASAAVASMVIVSLVMNPLKDICIYNVACMPAAILGGIYVLYSIFMSKRKNDRINHDAQIFGVILGLIFVLITKPAAILKIIEIFTKLF